MDTFNFSFFEDKPQESPKDTEETPSSPSSGTSESEAKTDDDPFGFDAFDMGDGDTPAETEDFALDAPNAPSSAQEDDFDLSSLSSGFSLNEPGNDSFPNLELEPSATASEAAEPLDMSFDAIRIEDDKAGDPFADLNFAPESSEEMAAEANEALTLGSTDAFEPNGNDPLVDNEPLAEIEPVAGMDPLDDQEPLPAIEHGAESEGLPDMESLAVIEPSTDPEPETAPEIATVLPPSDAADIRASVIPAVFLSPAPAPAQAPEPAVPQTIPDAPPAPPEAQNDSDEEQRRPASTPREGRARPTRFLTTDDPFGEVAPPRERLRVAVLGASGIGKNHARWFAKNSCDIVSFLGSSDESVELTRSHLQAHMGFSGQGYSDLGRLLSETQPQAVCIASPPHLHYAQAMQCLEAGVHVLCEKPLVYAPGRSRRENMDGARELLKAAAKRNLVLATQLQYGTATPILCRLAGVSPFDVGDFAMEIETTNPKSPRDPRELWIELAPHPLSVAQYMGGDGAEIVEETLQIMPSRSAYTSEVTARFGVRCEGGRLLMCRVIARWFDKIVDNREPRRRFSFNGRVVQYSGVKSPDGTYIAQYVAPDGYISHYSDPVDYLVGNFVRTCWDEDELILSSEQGVQNLDWLLSTVEKL